MGPRRKIRLLVVEDNPAYLFLVQKAFGARKERMEWELSIARDGEEAIRLLFAEEKNSAPLPDLILLDWNLPKISGIEVLRQVKQHRKLKSIPILIFSSSEAAADIQDAYGNHANGYIVKPSEIDGLASIIEAIERFCFAVRLPEVVR
jgi:CheY-like chemotaxis protein